jgi:hypothetical protein
MAHNGPIRGPNQYDPYILLQLPKMGYPLTCTVRQGIFAVRARGYSKKRGGVKIVFF